MQSRILQISSKLLALLLVVIATHSYGQEIVKVRNTNFTSYFSKTAHIPVLVVYTLQDNMLHCKRPNGESSPKYAPDPQVSVASDLADDYRSSMFDLAQMMCPAENICDRDAYKESYYFTNVMPMPKNLFKESWDKLNKVEMAKASKYKKIKVFAGTAGRNWTIGRRNDVVVPEYCWKVIYIPSKDEYECYAFHNIEPYKSGDKLENHKVDINTIESLAGVHFVNGIVSASYVVATPN